MKKIIIHVGPGKCGSSSIQSFFKNKTNPLIKDLQFTQISPKLISELNHDDPTENTIQNFNQFLDKALKSKNTLLVSHEYLFDCPETIKNICALAKNKVSEIIIIGYSRPQAEFIISTYSQWFFRVPERIKEVEKALIDNEIDPIHFNGLERHLIASIITDFHSARQLSNKSILNWYQSYSELEKIISPFNATLSPGVVPNNKASVTLIEDFCLRAGLKMKTNSKDAKNVKTNITFNRELIESLNTATQQNLNVPTPHQDNSYLAQISNNMNTITEVNHAFLMELKEYIDSYFLDENKTFCKKFEIDTSYFESQEIYTKNTILNYIRDEEKKRVADNYAIKYYRSVAALMAERCLSLIKEK